MIPSKCAVPVGDYESYADFEEVITAAYAIYDEPAKTFNFVRSTYRPTEGGSFMAPGGAVINCTNVYDVYEADNTAPSVAILTFTEEDGSDRTEISRDPDDITMATMAQKYGIMPQAEDYSTMATAAVNNAQPWVGQVFMSNVERVIFYDDVTPSSVVSFFKDFSSMTDIENLYRLNVLFCSDFSYMFYNASKINTLDISFFNIKPDANSYNTNSMFCGCVALSSLNIGELFKGKEVVTESMFSGCANLADLLFDVVGCTFTELASMFFNCASLTNINLSRANLFSSKLTKLFNGCSNLQHVDMSNCTGNMPMWGLFEALRSLVSVNFSGASITAINAGSMFESCENIESIDLRNVDFSLVNNYYYMFRGCVKLKHVFFNDTLGRDKTESLDGSLVGMFMNCRMLQEVDLGWFKNFNISNLQNTFRQCESLTKIDFTAYPKGISNMDSTCSKCSKLKTVRLWDVPPAPVNGRNLYNTFSNCTSLTTIYSDATYPESETLTFEGCTSLVGSAGTTYNARRITQTYARPDGGEASPGYFTPSSEYPGSDSPGILNEI